MARLRRRVQFSRSVLERAITRLSFAVSNSMDLRPRSLVCDVSRFPYLSVRYSGPTMRGH
jgi:hypothetical protein